MKKFVIISLILILAIMTACTSTAGQPADSPKGPISVGSKIDVEGPLLGEMIILMLRDNGFEVVDKTSFGPTPIVRAALESGELDIYPEYTGNGAFFFDEAGDTVWNNLETGYQRVKELDEKTYNITWLKPAPITNDWAISVPAALSGQKRCTPWMISLPMLTAVCYVKLIASEEFVNSELPAEFPKSYGFT
jgi:osmoprotectant transport system substrate-binding protein